MCVLSLAKFWGPGAEIPPRASRSSVPMKSGMFMPHQMLLHRPTLSCLRDLGTEQLGVKPQRTLALHLFRFFPLSANPLSLSLCGFFLTLFVSLLTNPLAAFFFFQSFFPLLHSVFLPHFPLFSSRTCCVILGKSLTLSEPRSLLIYKMRWLD